MAQGRISLKQIGLDKTNSRILIVTAIASFLVVFFLVGSYSLLQQLSYNNRVIGVKKTAVKQLETNIEATESLITSYEAFASAPVNIISGSPNGSGKQDGSNAKIVLDALPSKYDFPALTTSLERLALEQRATIRTIGGSDDEIAQGASNSEGDPQAVDVPFEITVEGDYATVQKVVEVMERSIRPFHISTLGISGNQQDLTLKVAGKTYYQPEKTLNIKMETVK